MEPIGERGVTANSEKPVRRGLTGLDAPATGRGPEAYFSVSEDQGSQERPLYQVSISLLAWSLA